MSRIGRGNKVGHARTSEQARHHPITLVICVRGGVDVREVDEWREADNTVSCPSVWLRSC